jgi:hypothetical protein
MSSTCGAPTKAGGACKKPVAKAGDLCHLHKASTPKASTPKASTPKADRTKADMQEVVATKMNNMCKDDLVKVTRYVENLAEKAKAAPSGPAAKTKVAGNGTKIAQEIRNGTIKSADQVTKDQLVEACKHLSVAHSGNKGPLFQRIKDA